MNIDEIRELLKSGDVAGAEASAKAALENDPDNVRLLIVFGTCRQLQGDEEAFLGTYELVRAALDEKKVELDATTAEEWRRFEALYERIAQPELLQKGDPPRKSNLMKYVILAVVVIAAVIVAVTCFWVREIERQYRIMRNHTPRLQGNIERIIRERMEQREQFRHEEALDSTPK